MTGNPEHRTFSRLLDGPLGEHRHVSQLPTSGSVFPFHIEIRHLFCDALFLHLRHDTRRHTSGLLEC